MAGSYSIAYVVSLSHSGSTLLDSLIGAHSKAFSAGEIDKLRSYALMTRERSSKSQLGNQCTCGAPTVWDCRFWQDVDGSMHGTTGLSLRDLDPATKDRAVFARDNRALFDAIAAVSKASVIVDSSKDRFRYQMLKESQIAPLLPMHLLRDPRGQVRSIMKRTGQPPYRSAVRYSLSTARTVLALRRVDHLRVRYESIAVSPEVTLSHVMKYLSLEFEPRQLRWADLPRHNVGGNHRRSTSDSTVMLDESWRGALTGQQELGIRLITYPVRFLWHEDLALRTNFR